MKKHEIEKREKVKGRKKAGEEKGKGVEEKEGGEGGGGKLHHLEDDCWALLLSIIYLSFSFPRKTILDHRNSVRLMPHSQQLNYFSRDFSIMST